MQWNKTDCERLPAKFYDHKNPIRKQPRQSGCNSKNLFLAKWHEFATHFEAPPISKILLKSHNYVPAPCFRCILPLRYIIARNDYFKKQCCWNIKYCFRKNAFKSNVILAYNWGNSPGSFGISFFFSFFSIINCFTWGREF